MTLDVVDTKGDPIEGLAVKPLSETNWNGKNDISTGNSTQADESTSDSNINDDEDAAIMMAPLMWAAALPLVAALCA